MIKKNVALILSILIFAQVAGAAELGVFVRDISSGRRFRVNRLRLEDPSGKFDQFGFAKKRDVSADVGKYLGSWVILIGRPATLRYAASDGSNQSFFKISDLRAATPAESRKLQENDE